MICFAAIIAGSFSLGRVALAHVDPVPLNALRFLFAALLLGIFTFGIRREPLVMPQAPWRFLITGGLMAFYFVSMFIALTMTNPVATSAVFTLTPLLAAFFGYFIVKQRLTGLMAVSLLFAGLGSIWVIFRGDLEALLGFDIGQGELIFFAGCIAHAIYAPLLRRFNRGEPLAALTFYNLAATAFWLTLVALPDLVKLNVFAIPFEAWLVIAYLAAFASGVTFFLLQFASVTLPASKVMAYGYLVPVFVITYEGLLGHGWVSVSVLTGALVTVLGLVVLYFAHDKRAG